MKALVLAAGQGNRLGDFTKHRPKGAPLFSLTTVLAHSMVTAAVYAYRACKHLYPADHDHNSRNTHWQDSFSAQKQKSG